MGETNWDAMLEDGRNLQLLIVHPGWGVLMRELKGAADALLVEMQSAKDCDRIALLAKEYAVLRSIEHKPSNMARIINMQYDRHRHDAKLK